MKDISRNNFKDEEFYQHNSDIKKKQFFNVLNVLVIYRYRENLCFW